MDKSLIALQDRKETVLAKIEAQGKLTDQLKASIEAAEKLADVEELYLPYKEKRRTKATIAREAGFFHWLVLSCKIVLTSRLKLKS